MLILIIVLVMLVYFIIALISFVLLQRYVDVTSFMGHMASVLGSTLWPLSLLAIIIMLMSISVTDGVITPKENKRWKYLNLYRIL